MDVRQLAFLASQPVAAVKKREHFWGMPKRGLAFLLANVMFWQPIWAQADGIVVSTPGTTLDQAGNGVPIVNIATPNGSGLSHNQFHDYNVGTQGVILNNVTHQTGATQLGGIIIGNSHLKNSGAAQTILNEVIGGSPSQLRGYTEVAGQSARVIVANPYGISCNGCGFINNHDGTVQASSQLTVAAQSINNRNASLTGKTLELASRGKLDNTQGTISSDDSVLGTQDLDNTQGLIQGNTSLKLVGRDLDNTEGKLLGGTVHTTLDTLTQNSNGTLSAEVGKLTLIVTQHLNSALGRLQATHGDVEIQAASIDNRQGIVAGQQLLLVAKGGRIDNRGGRIMGDRLDLQAASLDNSDNGLLAAGVDGARLILKQTAPGQSQLLNLKGRIQSEGGLQIESDTVDNSAGVLLGKTIDVTAKQLSNNDKGGIVSSDGTVELKVAGVFSNVTGVVDAGDQRLLLEQLTQLDNRSGTLRGKRLDISSTAVDNRNEGQIIAGSDGLKIVGTSLQNQQGVIVANGSHGELALGQGSLLNQGGTLQADSLEITAADLDNSAVNGKAGLISSLLGDLELTVTRLTNRAGKLFAKDQVIFDGSSLDNAGGEISGTRLGLEAVSQILNQGGLIESATGLNLISGQLNNSAGGQVRALGGASSQIKLTGNLNNQNGVIEIGSKDLILSGVQLNNLSGSVRHAAQGLFDLDLNNLTGSQGSLTGLGNGSWDIGSVNGVGTWQLNGGLLAMNSQLIGVLATAVQDPDADTEKLQTGAWVAQSGTLYNRQLLPDEIEFASDDERVKRFAGENGLTIEEAQQELLRTAAAMVDRGWNSVLSEEDGNTTKAAGFLRTELTQAKNDHLFQVSLADYNNERMGLVELFKDRTSLEKVLKNVALVDPLEYRTDAKYMQEVLNAKGEGSQEGFVLALEGAASGASKTALWAMGAANCPSCAANDIENAWNSILSLPEELRLKGYLDNLHIMQGGGAGVIRGNESSATAVGVGLGLAIDGGLAGVRSPTGIDAKGVGEVTTPAPHTPLAGPTDNWKNYTHTEAVIQTQASGRLVNAEKAVIDSNKVTSYALNSEHPVGGNKARVFESALGYNQSNAGGLIAKVQEGAQLYSAKLGAADKFGQRITIDMPITGPNGNTAIVRTGWIYDPGSSIPRMTTLYVK